MRVPPLILAAGSLVVLAFGYHFGPRIEEGQFPIVANFVTRDIVAQPNGRLHFRGSFTKLRACKPLSIVWFIEEPDDTFTPADDVKAVTQGVLINRPLGRQVSAWYDVPKPGVYVAFLEYDCRLPWTSTAKWGPFHVEPWINPTPTR